MDQLLREHIQRLKTGLLSLPATGAKGFEGLIGVTLSEITDVPFRLAGSGSQFGIDGKPTYEGNTISFEGKRYTGSVPRTEILSKIAELSINNNETDIWVLGVTSQIKTQIADDARALGKKDGIFILILDWSATNLPLLAIALAMGGTRVTQFLKEQVNDDNKLQETISAFDAIRKHPDFISYSDRIRAECNEPTIGLIIARRANTNWLIDTLSSKEQAIIEFGQPLSPGDETSKKLLIRKDIIKKVSPHLITTSDRKIIFILGGEGHGKSWIISQSWLEIKDKPLMILFNPDDFSKTSDQNDFTEILIKKLIKQTGDQLTARNQNRWRRKLEQWQNDPNTDIPKLVVVIDGVNQRPNHDWPRIIKKFGNELNKLDGRLLITSRTLYYNDRIKNRLSEPSIEINVPEWSETERNEILSRFAIDVSVLHPKVATSLRNPRLLAIALELLNKADIINFEELSISRLLFEHIRTTERDAPIEQPAQESIERLQKHAQKILDRVELNQLDDLKVFKGGIKAVAEGLFYQPIDGNPSLYTLNDDGLTLALGFSVIDRLLCARRNNRDIDAELYKILEPISALDDTADVVLAGCTIITIDDQFEQPILSSLIKGFADLQNPDEKQFIAFCGLARNKPQAFMDAAYALSLNGGYQPNFDWIQGALIDASRDPKAWETMTNTIHYWLSSYSLSPDISCFKHPGRDPGEEVNNEREKNRKKIEDKFQALTKNEQNILESLHEQDGDLDRLSQLAFILLAGKSLVSFAKSFLYWSFSTSLNSSHRLPYKDFWNLISFNSIDWSDTRSALLDASFFLKEQHISNTGKWTLVNILRATGDSDDSIEAKTLVNVLTKDRPRLAGWRLIEKYCETDPCDPQSKKPDNIIQTVKKYGAIDVNKLMNSMGHSSEDHFFIMARTSKARFRPEITIAKHRELISNVIGRSGLPLRQGVLELRKHNSLLTPKQINELISKYNEIRNQNTLTDLSESDSWFISQNLLLIIFPYLNAERQIEILLDDNAEENLLRDIVFLLKPLGKNKFASLLKQAFDEDNERNHYLLLIFAAYSRTELSQHSIKIIGNLFKSKSKRVRIQVINLIAQSDDEELLRIIAKSNWNAVENESQERQEIWYGSIALLKAARKGLITHFDALERISETLYGRAATMLDADTVNNIAFRIDASIRRILNLDEDIVVPHIELRITSSLDDEPNRFRVREESNENLDIQEAIKRLSESDDDFNQRQKYVHKLFQQFEVNLTKEKASIILDQFNLEEFEKILEVASEYSERWYQLFTELPESKRSLLYNFISLLAYSFANRSPEKSKNLFLKIRTIEPAIWFNYFNSNIEFAKMATWSCKSSIIIDELCYERLNQTFTDYDISQEVLAATSNDKQELLHKYIETKLESNKPAEIARGIMIAGFSDNDDFSDIVLKKYETSAGLIGNAVKAAKYAYERNIWARHWFKQMCESDKKTDFWRYSILFLKVVDGRFDVWGKSYVQKDNLLQLFGLPIENILENRYKKWKNIRNKKLFGLTAPQSIYL